MILAIDPGTTESAYVLIDAGDCTPVEFGKIPNGELLDFIYRDFSHPDRPDVPQSIDLIVIEMIASYGMPVGKEVFETVVWIGRYFEALRCAFYRDQVLVYRKPVKQHHCNSIKAKDSNIVQALVDRFAPGAPNHGKGTKAEPGFFYGFYKDIWQAMALAVYAADTMETPVQEKKRLWKKS